MIERVSWSFVKFTGVAGTPAYIDLWQVAAVTAAKAADSDALPGVLLGARVVLISGLALYTEESAQTVFEEVHRCRTEQEPPKPKIRLDGAPGPSSEPAPAAPIVAPVRT